MKRTITLMTICFIIVTSLTGCSNINKKNIDLSTAKTEMIDESIQKIEIMNILNDSNLFADLIVNFNENYKKENTKEENIVIIYDYMSDIYKLATNRIASDIDTIYINSEKYQSYIAMLQVYADTFSKEKDNIYNYLKETNNEITKLQSYRMLMEIHSFYSNTLSQVDNKETAK